MKTIIRFISTILVGFLIFISVSRDTVVQGSVNSTKIRIAYPTQSNQNFVSKVCESNGDLQRLDASSLVTKTGEWPPGYNTTYFDDT